MKKPTVIKKQKNGKFNEEDRLELVRLLGKAGYIVQHEKVQGKSEYVVNYWEPEEL